MVSVYNTKISVVKVVFTKKMISRKVQLIFNNIENKNFASFVVSLIILSGFKIHL